MRPNNSIKIGARVCVAKSDQLSEKDRLGTVIETTKVGREVYGAWVLFDGEKLSEKCRADNLIVEE